MGRGAVSGPPHVLSPGCVNSGVLTARPVGAVIIPPSPHAGKPKHQKAKWLRRVTDPAGDRARIHGTRTGSRACSYPLCRRSSPSLRRVSMVEGIHQEEGIPAGPLVQVLQGGCSHVPLPRLRSVTDTLGKPAVLAAGCDPLPSPADVGTPLGSPLSPEASISSTDALLRLLVRTECVPHQVHMRDPNSRRDGYR